nr:MAG TPA: hypothetical protein [Caudoviricetes sp.]
MIKIDRNYTDYRDDTDPKYPGGKAVNATTAEGTDGTPLLADWMNDINGALQALFLEAFGDINKVSGKPDNVQESDVLKAIKKITQDYTDKINNAESQARTQGDASTLLDAKRYSNELLAKIFQNGYIQWPGMPSPLEISALQFEGYSWYEINYSGSFFRAKGRNAKSFSPKKITKEQIKNGAYIFQNDEQGDAMRELEGTFGGDDSHFDHLSGVFKPKSHIKDLTTQADENDGWLIQFRASYQSPTAEENRPRNLTFVIWALVKDE